MGKAWTHPYARARWRYGVRRHALTIILVGGLGFLALGVGLVRYAIAPEATPIRLSADAPPAPPWQAALWRHEAPANRWQQIRRLGSGEDLDGFLLSQNITAKDRQNLLTKLRHHVDWHKLPAGQKIILLFAGGEAAQQMDMPKAQFVGLAITQDDTRWVVQRRVDNWHIWRQPLAQQTRLVLAEGPIRQDLYITARRAGVPPELTSDLLTLLGQRHIWASPSWVGGQLQVIFAQKSDAQNRFVNYGDILFFTITDKHQTHAWWRYAPPTEPAAYYDAQGVSLAPVVLPNPLEALPPDQQGTRPPNTQLTRSIAAPMGTHVIAAADGELIELEEDEQYGKSLRLAHADGIKSFYAYLQSFATPLRVGQTVRQGDRLGTVGQSGRTTSRQLFYAVTQNGAAMPWQGFESAHHKLSGEALAQFQAQRAATAEAFAALIAQTRSRARLDLP